MNDAHWLKRAGAAALAAGAMVVIVFLSWVPWRGPEGDRSELRVSWRIPAPSLRHCRPPTEAELEGVPGHMRPSEICNEETVAFHLTLLIGGDTLRAGPTRLTGRRARTLAVYERFPIPAGSHALEVSFVPASSPGLDAASPQMDSVRALGTTMSTRVVAAPGHVVLVTRDDSGRLVVSSTGPGR